MENQPELNLTKPTFKYFPFFNNKQPVFILVVLGIIFYCTSLYNEYALDDGILIHQNEHVIKGISGIPSIMTKDAYESFYRRMNATDQLAGGRYRPIASISYAIEQEFIHPYRSGLYMHVQDLNHNGRLDDEKVGYINGNGKAESKYEYNDFVDLNKNGIAEGNECYTCWDLNKNFKNDFNEDLNKDGVFNEIDCQVYGAELRHINNIWLYVLACIFIYLLLKNYVLKDYPDMAFLAALLFLIHPVHSEVVANIRGRDDIFSVIFIALTFICSFKFLEDSKRSHLILATLFFFLALLSKEYAVALFILIPVGAYVISKISIEWKPFLILSGLFILISCILIVMDIKQIQTGIPSIVFIFLGSALFFGISFLLLKAKIKQNSFITLTFTIYLVSLLYLSLRLLAVKLISGAPDTEVLNNPYVFATGQEELATKIYTLLKYFEIIIFPHPLISDYSFNSIALRNFTSWDFILSLLIHLALFYMSIKLILKRHILGFALLSYLLFLIIISGIFFPTGIMMLESNLFHASIGFSICVAWLAIKGIERLKSIKMQRSVLLFPLLIILVLFGCKTWERNWDWKNDITLFLKDVKNAPNSVLVLGNAGARWIDLADTKEITGVNIPGQDSTVFNDYNGTLKITPKDLKLYNVKTNRDAALMTGVGYLKRAVELHPKYVNGFLNLGLASFKLNNDRDAIYYWKRAEALYPNNPYLANYYAVYYNILMNRGTKALENLNYKEAILLFNYGVLIKPFEAEAWENLGTTYFTMRNYAKALEYNKKAKELGATQNKWVENKKEGC